MDKKKILKKVKTVLILDVLFCIIMLIINYICDYLFPPEVGEAFGTRIKSIIIVGTLTSISVVFLNGFEMKNSR